MRIRCILLLVCHIALVSIAYGQDSFYGKITDVYGTSLANVNVLLLDSAKQIKGFTTSNAQGYYKISTKNKSRIKEISFGLLGFKKQVIALDKINFEQDIILEEDNILLNEVTIKANAPILIKKDTTEYNVSHFSDGTERKIEEVLKKMPGIEVTDNGQILFKGKQIDKILVDNSDFANVDYRVLSKNLPARFITKVQAIENYNENHVLKNIENSDLVILNMKLDEEKASNKIFGEVGVSGGYKDKYHLQANLFSIGKKVKLYNITDVNNAELYPTFSVENNIYNLLQEYSSYASAQYIADYKLSETLTDRIKASKVKRVFNTFNYNIAPNEKIQISGNLNLNRNKGNEEQESEIVYSDSTIVREHRKTDYVPKTLSGKIKADIQPNKNTRIDYEGVFSLNNINNYFYQISDNLYYNTVNDFDFYHNKLDATVGLKKNSALKTTLLYNANNNKQEFGYKNNSKNIISQETNAKTRYFVASLKYYKRITNGLFYELALNYENNIQSLQGFAESEDSSSYNDINYQMNFFSAAGNISYRLRKSIFDLHIIAGNRRQNIKTYTKNKIEILPKFSYRLELNKRHKLSLFVSYNRNPININNHTDQYLFTGYRNVLLGTDQYEGSKVLSSGLSYFYFNILQQTSFLLSYIYTNETDGLMNEIKITPNVNTTHLNIGKDKKNHFLISNLKKFIDPLYSGINWDTSLGFMQYYNNINSDVLRLNKSVSLSSKLSIKSALDFPVNFTLGGLFNYVRFKVGGDQASETTNYSLFQDISLKIKRITAKLSCDQFFLGKPTALTHLVNANLKYSFPKQKMSVGVSAYNLLQEEYISNYSITDYYSYKEILNILPMQVLLNIEFTF